jgi:hypothetical protein
MLAESEGSSTSAWFDTRLMSAAPAARLTLASERPTNDGLTSRPTKTMEMRRESSPPAGDDGRH